MKIQSVGTEFFNAYGRTDGRAYMTNLMVAFLNFAEAPKHASCWNGAIEAMSMETIVLVEMVDYCQIFSLAFRWL
jgi:hypothetical protein